MSFLFKPGYGSKLPSTTQLPAVFRDVVIKGLGQRFLELYQAYRDDTGNALFDIGNDDFVNLVNPYDLEFDHILFWLAKASGIDLTAGELFALKEDLIEYASEHGLPSKGYTLWDVGDVV